MYMHLQYRIISIIYTGELSQQLRETKTKILFVTPDVAGKGREAAALTESVKVNLSDGYFLIKTGPRQASCA